MNNQSQGCDSYGWWVLRPTPNCSICLWYSYSEYSADSTGVCTPWVAA